VAGDSGCGRRIAAESDGKQRAGGDANAGSLWGGKTENYSVS